jgi:hypothetical protein
VQIVPAPSRRAECASEQTARTRARRLQLSDCVLVARLRKAAAPNAQGAINVLMAA